MLQIYSQTTTTQTHHKLEYKNTKHGKINSKTHQIPINLNHFGFECLILHISLLASLEWCFCMFWSKPSSELSVNLNFLFIAIFDLEEEDETINGGSKISREKQKKMSSWWGRRRDVKEIWRREESWRWKPKFFFFLHKFRPTREGECFPTFFSHVLCIKWVLGPTQDFDRSHLHLKPNYDYFCSKNPTFGPN